MRCDVMCCAVICNAICIFKWRGMVGYGAAWVYAGDPTPVTMTCVFVLPQVLSGRCKCGDLRHVRRPMVPGCGSGERVHSVRARMHAVTTFVCVCAMYTYHGVVDSVSSRGMSCDNCAEA